MVLHGVAPLLHGVEWCTTAPWYSEQLHGVAWCTTHHCTILVPPQGAHSCCRRHVSEDVTKQSPDLRPRSQVTPVLCPLSSPSPPRRTWPCRGRAAPPPPPPRHKLDGQWMHRHLTPCPVEQAVPWNVTILHSGLYLPMDCSTGCTMDCSHPVPWTVVTLYHGL